MYIMEKFILFLMMLISICSESATAQMRLGPLAQNQRRVSTAKFETQTVRTGQSIWGIVKDHKKMHPWYTREIFLADNPEIADRKPYTKLDPCDSTKVLYSTPPIHPGETYRLRLDEGGPVNPPNVFSK